MARYIDADAYIKYCEDNCVPLNEYAVKSQPTIDVTPVVHAKWIGKPIAGYCTVRCSYCRNVFLENNGKWKYCPECGAKMGE